MGIALPVLAGKNAAAVGCDNLSQLRHFRQGRQGSCLKEAAASLVAAVGCCFTHHMRSKDRAFRLQLLTTPLTLQLCISLS